MPEHEQAGKLLLARRDHGARIGNDKSGGKPQQHEKRESETNPAMREIEQTDHANIRLNGYSYHGPL
jgi:hypothetical protein